MHSYIRTKDNGDTLYVVGHWLTGTWQPLAVFSTLIDAAQWVAFLNGGIFPRSLPSDMGESS